MVRLGGNGTCVRKYSLFTIGIGAVLSSANAPATNCGNGHFSALPNDSSMSIEKFSRPFSRPDKYWYVMPLLSANCSWVSFDCSRNLRTNLPNTVLASISALVEHAWRLLAFRL